MQCKISTKSTMVSYLKAFAFCVLLGVAFAAEFNNPEPLFPEPTNLDQPENHEHHHVKRELGSLTIVTNIRAGLVAIINAASRVGLIVDFTADLVLLSDVDLKVGIIVNINDGVIYPVQNLDLNLWWSRGNSLRTVPVYIERRYVRLIEITRYVPVPALTRIIQGLWLDYQIDVNDVLSVQIPTLFKSLKTVLSLVTRDVRVPLKGSVSLLNNILGAAIRVLKSVPGGIVTLQRSGVSVRLDLLVGGRTGVQVLVSLLESLVVVDTKLVSPIIKDKPTLVIHIAGLGGSLLAPTIDGVFSIYKDIELLRMKRITPERFLIHFVTISRIGNFQIQLEVELQPLLSFIARYRISAPAINDLIKNLLDDRYVIGDRLLVENVLEHLQENDLTSRLPLLLGDIESVIAFEISLPVVFQIISQAQCDSGVTHIIELDDNDEYKIGFIELQAGLAIDTSVLVRIEIS